MKLNQDFTRTTDLRKLEDFEPGQPRPTDNSGATTKLFNPEGTTGVWRWEIDEYGNHAIVDGDGVRGAWTGYSFIAVSPCGQFFAATLYHAGSGLPAETLVRMTPTVCHAAAGANGLVVPATDMPAANVLS